MKLQHKMSTRILLFAITITITGVASATAPTQTLQTIPFASNTGWKVTDLAGNDLGKAQAVCLDVAGNCPPGTTAWGYGGNWGADISSLAGAKWIWAPGLNADSQPAHPAYYMISNNFSLKGGRPRDGMISIAADDFAVVYVNNWVIGSLGSTDEEPLAAAASSALHTFSIPAMCLNKGNNTITVLVGNGNFGCGSGAYQCNPAGVVFGGILLYEK